MKKIITLLLTLLLAGWSLNAWSFACKTAAGVTIPIGGGSANVYVNLAPAVSVIGYETLGHRHLADALAEHAAPPGKRAA